MKGEYLQTVPSYSAKKRKGKHLYDYAREGIEIEEIRNNVNIYEISNATWVLLISDLSKFILFLTYVKILFFRLAMLAVS